VQNKITPEDWKLLVAMRQAYLTDKAQTHWSSTRSFELYDHFFGQRIADKWSSALSEFLNRSHAEVFFDWCTSLSAPLQVWDWGCGTGRASRTFHELLVRRPNTEIVLTDRSTAVEDWAFSKISQERKGVSCEVNRIASSQLDLSRVVLLVSHVLNELDNSSAGALSDVAARAEWVFWVENGSKTTSRHLAQVRNKLRHTHEILAPCLGQSGCQAIDGKDHTHWCHFFAKRSADYFLDPEWTEFSKQLGVDLRSIPYSFFIARKRVEGDETVSPLSDKSAGVLIGKPRVYKGYADALVCGQDTRLVEWRYQKKYNTEVYREFKKEKSSFVVPMSNEKSKVECK
jgi:hypothetical protein